MTTTRPPATPPPARQPGNPTPTPSGPDRSTPPPDAGTTGEATPGAGTAEDAATAAAMETLVNCYLRESEGWWFDGDELVVPLPRRGPGVEVRVAVGYRSATFRHRYRWPARLLLPGPPVRSDADADSDYPVVSDRNGHLPPGNDGAGSRLGFAALAGLLLDELRPPAAGTPAPAGAATVLLGRMLESVQNVGDFLDLRREEIDRLWSADPLPFIESEQALLLGHPLHPTPKSRGEMNPRERRAYSPETRAELRLRWVAAAPHMVRHASATGTPAPELAEQLARHGSASNQAAVDAVRDRWPDRILLPAHPWELDHLLAQPDTAELFERGGLVDVGPLGDPVTPTTSVRTVYRGDWPWQLKFSLHVRVTNSLRVTLPKELDRAVEAARLGRTEVGAAAARVAPCFRFVHDPAYLTVVDGDRVVSGFSVLLRENPWPAGVPAVSGMPGVPGVPGNVSAVTTLCQDHPFGGPSRLARIVARRATAQRRSPHEVGREWFARFLDVAVVSLVRLYLDLGLCFEPHQQNTLLELDAVGWPERCAYRDSQGYFHRELAHDNMCAVIPGLGEATESIFPEDLADERLVYYPFLNLTLGVINALGAGGVADEAVLLADLRRCLEVERARGGRYPATLLDRLLDDERWPCKGNLRTRYHDMDELVGDIETQSVYVTLPNPLKRDAESARLSPPPPAAPAALAGGSGDAASPSLVPEAPSHRSPEEPA